MRTNKIIVALALLLGTLGCSDWLDVKPRTEIEQEVMFSSENGFKTALNGVYILLADQSLYGKNTSMYFPEFLARHWVSTNEMTERLLEYDYTYSSIESLIDNIWTKYYTAIANLNNVITNVKNSPLHFSHGNDSIIRGEAVGLRGFLHLELLRLFGPVPQGADMGKPAIPYVEEMGKEPEKLKSLPYREVLAYIIRDLKEAENYLKADPVLKGSIEDLNNPGASTVDYAPDDDWHYYRQRRFKYYAVKAAQARYYMWAGDQENAGICAKEVIGAVNPDGRAKFRLADETDYSGDKGNTIMQCEHLFGVINSSLQSIVQGLFKNANPQLSQTETRISNAYETGVNPNDIRYHYYWETQEHDGTETHHFRKYTGTDEIKSQDLVPLLRLSEMYLIMMECLSPTEALEYFKVYRLSRGLNNALESNFETSVPERLESEYRKEFYGEGQMFYFYKRNKYTRFTWPVPIDVKPEVYVVPVPQSQTVFE